MIIKAALLGGVMITISLFASTVKTKKYDGIHIEGLVG